MMASTNKPAGSTSILHLKFHDLRHDRASTLAAGGASLAQIAEVLNHKTLQMVKRYAHLTEGNLEEYKSQRDREAIFGFRKLSIIVFNSPARPPFEKNRQEKNRN